MVDEHSAIDTAQRIVHVSAVVIRNHAGHVLTVRKAASHGFMMPGGKPDAGESPLHTAVREVTEELGFAPDPAQMVYLGKFDAPALNESGFVVCAETFEYVPHPQEEKILEQLSPHAEIAELRWVDPTADYTDQAPLNTERIFPLICSISPGETPSVPL